MTKGREFIKLVEIACKNLDNFLDDINRQEDEDEGPRKPKPGEILIAERGLKWHYGIYSGNNRVIHYTEDHADDEPDNAEITETSLEQFVKDNPGYFILDRYERYFNAEQTLIRARSLLGERKHNLITKNCEHFQMWCRYGVNGSFDTIEWDKCHKSSIFYICPA